MWTQTGTGTMQPLERPERAPGPARVWPLGRGASGGAQVRRGGSGSATGAASQAFRRAGTAARASAPRPWPGAEPLRAHEWLGAFAVIALTLLLWTSFFVAVS